MTRRLVGWLVLIPFCAVLVVFALANRDPVPLRPTPFSGEVSVPLFVVIYAMLILGVFLGGIATWFAQGAERRERRHWRREAERLARDLDNARRRPARPAEDHLVDSYNL